MIPPVGIFLKLAGATINWSIPGVVSSEDSDHPIRNLSGHLGQRYLSARAVRHSNAEKWAVRFT
jgi:hypothetical protein